MTTLPRAATSDELTKLRNINQSSRLYLTVHAPATVYTARLASVPTSTDSVVSIAYNSGSGTSGSILAHQTLLVGTSAGASDLGMCRIRSTTGIGATSGTFAIAETSEISWASGAYLTVLDEFLLWRRDPRVVGSTIYMDYDVAFSDQHAKCASIPVLGPPAVKWLIGSTVTVNFDASQSWTVNNTITGYSWAFPGASATSGTTTATPTATYNATGTYRAACTITNSDGVSSTGYRYVFVITENSSIPALINHFNLDSLSGDYASGGWSAQVTIVNQADLTTIRDRSMAILHTRDWYGKTAGDEGSVGMIADRENIQLVGWISLETDKLAPQDQYSSTTFTIYGPQYWLNKMTAFPAGLKDRNSAAQKWTRFYGLTGKAAAWHILEWRTTAPRMMDCFPMDNSVRAARLDAPGAQTIWTQLSTIIDNALIAKPCCDSYARLFMQIEQNLLPTATRSSIPTVMTLTRPDWTNEINFDRRQVDEVGYIDMSGVVWNGTTPTPVFSLSPGHVFRHYGSAEVRERLVLYDQTTTNTLCGAYYGWRNNPYPRFSFDLAMNNHLIDLAPYQYLAIDIAATDTPRGFAASGLRLIPRAIQRQWNAQYGFFSTQVECEAESTVGLAITGDVPAAPPEIPTNPPPPPPPPPPPVPTLDQTLAGAIAFVLKSGGGSAIVYAGDINSISQPTWTLLDLPSGLSTYITNATRFDSVIYVSSDGERLILTARISGTDRITECTNWTSIKNNPTPPAPVWTDWVIFGTSTISGGTVDFIGTLTAGQGYFDSANVFYFTCTVGGTWALGAIALDGSLSKTNPSQNNANHGIGFNVFNDISLTAGTSHVRSYAGTSLYSFTGSVFGTQEAGTPYRNEIGGAAVTSYIRSASPDKLSIRHSAGFIDVYSGAASGDLIVFGGNPLGTVIYESNSLNSDAQVSTDSGATWGAYATWLYGKIIGVNAATDAGAFWMPYTSVASGNVPARIYDNAGNVVNDLTGNWWSTIFSTSSTTQVITARGWYRT